MAAKSPKEKIASGVTDTINKANRIRTTPRLARLSRLPGNQSDLTALLSMGRKARNRLLTMRKQSAEKFAQIEKDKAAEFKHWGMTEGEKPGIWADNVGVDQRVLARSRAVDKAKKLHAKTTANEATEIIKALRGVNRDLDLSEPLFHTPVAMLLRQTMGDGNRAKYMRILQGAGPVAIQNAVLDCIIGEGDKALGAALVTLIENSKTLQKAVSYSREEIAEALVGDDYWDAFESIGLMRYFIEQSEVATLEMAGSSVSADRKLRAGLMKQELEKATAKLFNEAGDPVDGEGNVLSVADSKPSSDDYYENILAESRARDAAVAKEKRRQAVEARLKSEADVLKITQRTEAEENALYGGES